MKTENAGMPDVIYAVPYNEGGHGEWDDMKWTPCPFVLNDRKPEDETAYVRKSIVTPESAREALDDVIYCLEQVSSNNPYAAEKCLGMIIRSGETIRALLIAHGGNHDPQ